MLRALWLSLSLSPRIPAMAVGLSKDKVLLLGLPRNFCAWFYHNQCLLEFTSLRKTPYAGASAVSSSHLCTVQGAVLPQFPSSVKHQPGLTEAAFPRAEQMLLGVIL